jgi:LuxR family quorum sensing-dependent transcriptional regulator
MELAPANATLVLTPQQLKVLQLYAEGYTEKMIASKLAISTHWVHEMGKRLRGRLGARNTAHAVAIGLRDGIIE